MWHTGKKEGKEEIRSNRRVIKYISTYVHGKKQGGERGAEGERGEREESCITSGYILIQGVTVLKRLEHSLSSENSPELLGRRSALFFSLADWK